MSPLSEVLNPASVVWSRARSCEARCRSWGSGMKCRNCALSKFNRFGLCRPCQEYKPMFQTTHMLITSDHDEIRDAALLTDSTGRSARERTTTWKCQAARLPPRRSKAVSRSHAQAQQRSGYSPAHSLASSAVFVGYRPSTPFSHKSRGLSSNVPSSFQL